MQEQQLFPFQVSEGILVAPPSYLIDRFVPDCEFIWLPEKEVAGGVLRFGFGALPPHEVALSRRERLTGFFKRPRRSVRRAPNGAVFDLRRNTPQNWAHFLNNHLPIVFHVCDRLEIDSADVVLVTPQKTPGYIRMAAQLFGLQLIATDDRLDGQGVLYDVVPWTASRTARAEWVATDRVRASLEALSGDPLPRKVYLSRRGTRFVSNEDAVMAWLEPRGYVRVYPEDLSPADQIRLFREAQSMVAIHGAGLAPLLYTSPGNRPDHLIEILPCGHMTDVYRVMAQQVGCGWVGVRGRLKPEYVKPAYDFRSRFDQFSLDGFEVDLVALAAAFDRIGIS